MSRFADNLKNELSGGFSKTVLDHAMNPRNVGRLKDEDGYASFTGPCGGTMMISIKVTSKMITEARFWTDGCGSSIATGSMVTEMAIEKALDDAMMTGQSDVLEAPEGLPEESEHCALLAATILHMAIDEYQEKEKDK